MNNLTSPVFIQSIGIVGTNHYIRHGEKPLIKGETKLEHMNKVNNVVGPKESSDCSVFSQSQNRKTEDLKNLVGDPQYDESKVVIECPSGYFQNGRSSTWIHERNLE